MVTATDTFHCFQTVGFTSALCMFYAAAGKDQEQAKAAHRLRTDTTATALLLLVVMLLNRYFNITPIRSYMILSFIICLEPSKYKHKI